ncbi:hypothetical protein WDU94_005522 [Cyamophila willieti]
MSAVKKTSWICDTCLSSIIAPKSQTKDKESNTKKDKSKKDGSSSSQGLSDITKETMDGLKLYFEQKFNEQNKQLHDQKEEIIQALNLKVENLENKIKERDSKISDLEERVDKLENRQRIMNIEIRNMPETKNEDVKYLVKCIGKTIGIPNIAESDIQVAHRVNNRNGGNGSRPIVAHMSSRFMRNQWLEKFKQFKQTKGGNVTAKQISGSLPDTKIFMHEHITVNRKLLLNEVREFAKANQIKFVWIKDSMILVKKDESSRQVTKISTKKEFEIFQGKQNF